MAVRKTLFLLPKTKDGFVDHKSIFKIVYTDLKQPYGILTDLTVQEVSWLIEGNLEHKKDHYEMIAYAMKTAMASVMQGKDIRLFDDGQSEESEDSEGKQLASKEMREEDLAYLENKFGEL